MENFTNMHAHLAHAVIKEMTERFDPKCPIESLVMTTFYQLSLSLSSELQKEIENHDRIETTDNGQGKILLLNSLKKSLNDMSSVIEKAINHFEKESKNDKS